MHKMNRREEEFAEVLARVLHEAPLQTALARLTETLYAGNRRGFAALPEIDRLRDQARAIKEHTLAHLDQYLEQLADAVVRRGGQVWWAADAAEARQRIVQLAQERGCRQAVKAKSMTTEEIHLNEALQAAGITVTETDFGEFVIQLAGERPSHLVAPAVHHPRADIARILSQHLGQPLPDEPQVLAQAARRHLRQRFFHADLGITGANFLIAETGTLVLVTNEGNARLTTTWPRVHIALAGIEKVLPRWCDLPVFLKLLARAATGQTLSVYTTLLTGPRRPGEADGPEEFHLILLDNGRSRILASPFRESLHCLRCGACLNACPVYRHIGGHAYGGVYAGPIGSILTPLYEGLAHYAHLPHASSLCGACQAACPVKIPIPRMLIGLRELARQQQPRRGESGLYRLWAALLCRPWLYRLVVRWSHVLLRPWARRGWLRRLPGPAAGWTQVRDFPLPAARPFHVRWRQQAR
jgi:L-lactate dehydrogenase complex protein LldF